MIPIYQYRLWDGKKQIGVFCTSRQLEGSHLVLPVFSFLKEPYAPSKQRKNIKLPLEWLNTVNSHSMKVFELVVVVKGRSKKQKDIISKAGGNFYILGEKIENRK